MLHFFIVQGVLIPIYETVGANGEASGGSFWHYFFKIILVVISANLTFSGKLDVSSSGGPVVPIRLEHPVCDVK